jgi:hypothetical protein
MAASTGQTHDCILTAIVTIANLALDAGAPSTHDPIPDQIAFELG